MEKSCSILGSPSVELGSLGAGRAQTMKKSYGIRLWAPALIVGVALSAFGVRLEAQALRHRAHEKLMRAFLDPAVFEGTSAPSERLNRG